MKRPLRVTKMSGAGNDFVVLDADEAARLGDGLLPWVRRVCRRGLSLGADGVLVVARGESDRVRVRFYNPDGSAAFCGNGSRCAARFARLRGWTGDSMTLETDTGTLEAQVRGSGVLLRLPAPRDRGPRGLDLGGELVEGRWIDAGAPHFVTFVDAVAGERLARWGPRVRRHAALGAEGANFDLVARGAGGAVLELRTWERGVEGETLSCGSGAIAAAFAARLAGGPAELTVLPASGVPLRVSLPGEAATPRCAVLEGDARVLLQGELTEEATDWSA